mmetsp:Transcript_23260/g.73157  ORF Transcript_23260/g.73157 Transcript_23260/m.73157 type:complete len:327 (+) Transcript_23260:1846-2826(+)
MITHEPASSDSAEETSQTAARATPPPPPPPPPPAPPPRTMRHVKRECHHAASTSRVNSNSSACVGSGGAPPLHRCCSSSPGSPCCRPATHLPASWRSSRLATLGEAVEESDPSRSRRDTTMTSAAPRHTKSILSAASRPRSRPCSSGAAVAPSSMAEAYSCLASTSMAASATKPTSTSDATPSRRASASPHQTATSSDQQPTHWRMSDAARRALASWYESALHCSDSVRSRASRSNSRSTIHEKRRKETTRVTAQAAPLPARGSSRPHRVERACDVAVMSGVRRRVASVASTTKVISPARTTHSPHRSMQFGRPVTASTTNGVGRR